MLGIDLLLEYLGEARPDVCSPASLVRTTGVEADLQGLVGGELVAGIHMEVLDEPNGGGVDESVVSPGGGKRAWGTTCRLGLLAVPLVDHRPHSLESSTEELDYEERMDHPGEVWPLL